MGYKNGSVSGEGDDLHHKLLRHARIKGRQQDLGPFRADAGEKTPWDIPLIRVAAKKGAYWYHDQIVRCEMMWVIWYHSWDPGMAGIQVFRSFWD